MSIKRLAFQCSAKLVALSPARLDPARNESSDTLLSTTEPLKLIETYLYTHRQSPIHLEGCIRRKKTPNRHWQATRDSFLHVWLTQSGAKPLIWQILERQDCFHLTLLRHQNVKTSLYTIFKNSWVLPFLVNLTPVTMKLQLTVFLDHPVVTYI